MTRTPPPPGKQPNIYDQATLKPHASAPRIHGETQTGPMSQTQKAAALREAALKVGAGKLQEKVTHQPEDDTELDRRDPPSESLATPQTGGVKKTPGGQQQAGSPPRRGGDAEPGKPAAGAPVAPRSTYTPAGSGPMMSRKPGDTKAVPLNPDAPVAAAPARPTFTQSGGGPRMSGPAKPAPKGGD